MNRTNLLVRVRTAQMRNDSHHCFHMENEKLYKRYNPVLLGIDEFMDRYRKALQDEADALARARMGVGMARIDDIDKRFNSTWTAMRMQLQNCLKHPKEEIRLSAINILDVVNRYEVVGKRKYRERLNASNGLSQELSEHSEDVERLRLKSWIDAHREASWQLTFFMERRDAMEANKSKMGTKEARTKVDAVYRLITSRIEAMADLNGYDYVPGFISLYNVHATRFRNMLAIHLGRLRKKRERERERELEQKREQK